METDLIADDYTHVNKDIFYCTTSVPGPGVTEHMHDEIKGCECEGVHCTLENKCACVQYVNNYSRDDLGHLKLSPAALNTPIFECSSNCKCFGSLSCQNRLVQFGPLPCIKIFDTLKKGYGLQTTKNIVKLSFVCEYAGEVIGMEEAQKRFQQNTGMNYIFVLKEHHKDGILRTCVDPSIVGNIGRYANHSCQPNCMIVPVRIGAMLPKLCLFSIRDILEGEEITYDYSGEFQFDQKGLKPVSDSCKLTNCDLDVNLRKHCFCFSDNCKLYVPYTDLI